MTLTLDVSPGFDLSSTIRSHGWYALPPFTADDRFHKLRMNMRLSSGGAVPIDVEQPTAGALRLTVPPRLNDKSRREVTAAVRSALRIDEDLTEFYRATRRYPEYRWIGKRGAGRLLRSPHVFEDAVKMMCTTNCSWALTEIIVKNLCRHFGERIDEGQYCFPQPAAIAESSERFLRKHVRAGYRAPYILELSRRAVRKQIDLEGWRNSRLPTPELYEEVIAIKGLGPYAAGNILKLLGRYDYLGIDSWCRKKFFALHGNGKRKTDKAIADFYEPHGKWRGLVFWLDVTRDWYGVVHSRTADKVKPRTTDESEISQDRT